jgi:hypothetical protein
MQVPTIMQAALVKDVSSRAQEWKIHVRVPHISDTWTKKRNDLYKLDFIVTDREVSCSARSLLPNT